MRELVRVTMPQQVIKRFPLPKGMELLGGRGLTSAILCEEVSPQVDALGAYNKLILAPGLLTGTYASSSGRLSVGAKSPLTGGIKESNVGGTAGRKLALLGIAALILEGKAQNLSVLHLSKNGIRFDDANDLKEVKSYETVDRLRKIYGDKATIIGIGPAGERCFLSSGIFVTDLEGRPCRYAARGGLGAVMGAKNIKAIVIDASGTEGLAYTDREEFLAIARGWAKELVKSRKVFTEYGTAILIRIINEMGGLPTRNFRRGSFEHYAQISGEKLRENVLNRGGKVGHPCHTGCVIRCSNIYRDSQGKYLTSALEYETIGLMGANLEIDDLDTIAEIDRMCDELGIDTIETANALAVAIEAGLAGFGDKQGIKNLILEIERNSSIGKILGSGARRAAEVLGVTRVATVKSQGLSSYDPRCVKGTGVTFLTSPMGADHTAANILPGRTGYHYDNMEDESGVTSAENKIGLSRDVQVMVAVCDTLGFCFFVGPTRENMDLFARFIQARFGYSCTAIDLIEMGRDVISREIAFNSQAGLPPVSRFPDFIYDESLPDKGLTFDVDSSELSEIWR